MPVTLKVSSKNPLLGILYTPCGKHAVLLTVQSMIEYLIMNSKIFRPIKHFFRHASFFERFQISGYSTETENELLKYF